MSLQRELALAEAMLKAYKENLELLEVTNTDIILELLKLSFEKDRRETFGILG